VALQALHDRQVIHRDLKPHNIMVRESGEPVLMDFGLARALAENQQRLTTTGKVLGTPAYMPPDQLEGDPAAVGPAADVYSLGVILFELLTGRRPFDASQLERLFYQVLTQPAPRPSALRPGLPARLDAVCGKALAKKPEERHARMADLAADLEAYLRDSAAPPGPTPAAAAVEAPPLRPVACPRCGTTLMLPAPAPGRPFQCPHCRARLQLGPVPPTPGQPGAPAFPPVGQGPDQQSTRIERRRVLSVSAALLLGFGMAIVALLGWWATHRPSGDTSEGALRQVRTEPREGREPARSDKEAATDTGRDAGGGRERGGGNDTYGSGKGKDRSGKDKAGLPERKPARKAGHVVTVALGGGLDMRFTWCPPGTFQMGSPPAEEERSDGETQHRVTLTKGFYLGIHEVTQAQWQAVMGSNPSEFKGKDDAEKKCLPVENVSWLDCVEFCVKLGERQGKRPCYRLTNVKRRPDGSIEAADVEMLGGSTGFRLPTEAEWEYACRAGTTTPFCFGETISTDQANYDGNFAYGKGKKGVYRKQTTPVGSFPANAWGLYDMHGNVWEWCQDWYGPYPSRDIEDPQGADKGDARVMRGGSWYYDPGRCRAAYRDGCAPAHRCLNDGCRVVLCLD
jgi:formylglycine-generating enzyme required for sulfatase activity